MTTPLVRTQFEGALRPKIDHQNSGARLCPLGRERRMEPKPLEILDPVA